MTDVTLAIEHGGTVVESTQRRTRRRWTNGIVATWAVLALVAGACGGDDDSDDTSDTSDTTEVAGDPTGTFTYGSSMALSSFDPAKGSGATGVVFQRPMFDTLVDNSSPDGTLEGALAESWEVSSDGLTVTLSLREGVTFTDGTPFTADVVRENIVRLVTTPGNTQRAYQDVALEPDGTTPKVEAVDDTTVEFTLAVTSPTFVNGLGGRGGMMVSPGSFADVDANPVGTGPYVYDAARSVRGDRYVYTLNEDFWDPSQQGVEELVIRELTDPSARQNALLTGEIDATTVEGSGAAQVESGGFTILPRASAMWTMLIMDREGDVVPALGDVRVRQALAYAADREGFVNSVLFGYGEASSQLYSEGQLGHDPELDDRYELDLVKAKELLAEAGYPDGFTFKAASIAPLAQGITAFQGFFEEIGVTMEITNVDPSQYSAVSEGTEYQVFIAPFPQSDPIVQSGNWFGKSPTTGQYAPQNGYKNEDVDMVEIQTRAKEVVDTSKRGPVSVEFAETVLEEAYAVVAAHSQTLAAYGDNVTDFEWGQFDPDPNLRGVRVES